MPTRRAATALLLSTPLVLSAADPANPTRIASNVGAGEGPVWRDGWLWFTGNNQISRRHHETGKVEVWKDNAGGANGLLFTSWGSLVVCEGTSRRVVQYDLGTKSSTVLADSWNGKRLNSPNDLTVDRRGRIYFSDPRYGSRDSMELDDEGVYRIDAPGKITRIIGKADGIQRPNGVCLSYDGRYLYVADNNNNTAGGARKLWRMPFRLETGTVHAVAKELVYDWGTSRGPDGLKTDRTGRLYVAAGRTSPRPQETTEKKGGIYVVAPPGKLEAFLPVTDDEVTNCAFGGPDMRTLFITAGGNLWSWRATAR